jgi:hypothetical protein
MVGPERGNDPLKVRKTQDGLIRNREDVGKTKTRMPSGDAGSRGARDAIHKAKAATSRIIGEVKTSSDMGAR